MTSAQNRTSLRSVLFCTSLEALPSVQALAQRTEQNRTNVVSSVLFVATSVLLLLLRRRRRPPRPRRRHGGSRVPGFLDPGIKGSRDDRKPSTGGSGYMPAKPAFLTEP